MRDRVGARQREDVLHVIVGCSNIDAGYCRTEKVGIASKSATSNRDRRTDQIRVGRRDRQGWRDCNRSTFLSERSNRRYSPRYSWQTCEALAWVRGVNTTILFLTVLWLLTDKARNIGLKFPAAVSALL
jgi:hypothetical protein